MIPIQIFELQKLNQLYHFQILIVALNLDADFTADIGFFIFRYLAHVLSAQKWVNWRTQFTAVSWLIDLVWASHLSSL